MLITRGSTQIPTRCTSGSLICSNVAKTVQVSKHCSKVVSFACCIRKLSANASLSVNCSSKLVSFSSPISLLSEIVIYYNECSSNCQRLKFYFFRNINCKNGVFYKKNIYQLSLITICLPMNALVFVHSSGNGDHCIFLLSSHYM